MKIYTGQSRVSKTWKLWECDWGSLTERLEKPIRTQESFAEYKSLGKLKQGQIKDVGGFVGGVLKNGVRSAATVLERWLITLDADSPEPGFIERCFRELKCNFCIYSTHSHAPESNRYRLIIPTDRPMHPDEYEAVARRVAFRLGIDNFDDSTYEPSRLMYWPSCSRDAHYVFETQDFMGSLAVNEVLGTYTDWKDCSQWPVSSRMAFVHKKDKVQADPLRKGGLIGAFCKAYNIREAIETFIPDVYKPTGSPGRWTFAAGSSFGGLVVYDEKFAFSNHGTDPAGGKLCNAFDLVRIHKFGQADLAAGPDTPANKLPSFIDMSNFASELPKVKAVIVSDAFASADAEAPIAKASGDVDSWVGDLEIDKAGRIKDTASNVKLILNNDPALKSIVFKDEFAERLRMKDCPPWRSGLEPGEAWQDCDDAGLRVYMEKTYGITQIRKIDDGFSVWTEEHKRHPVREYLDALVWDGIPRLDSLLIDYLGALDTEYTRAVTRKAFTAAVTRIYNPGAKFDSMLVLVGPQGIGKSTIIQKLGGAWHTDSLTSVQGKEGPEQILGFWLIEMGELTAMKKAEETSVKQFLSKREDSFRPAYGRHTRVYPRQCVFFGTTNVDTFLKDATGNRRFWVVVCNEYPPTKDVFALDESVRGQIWAEAKECFRKGEPLFLNKELEREAHRIQEAHREESPYAGAVRKYLNMEVPAGFESWELPNKIIYFNSYNEEEEHPDCEPMKRVCPLMLWVEALGGNPANLDKLKAKEINEIVRNAEGWQATPGIHFSGIYGNQRGFRKR